ncbi:hypothetical protein AURDEDRAFT_164462 [Auricularia subglabra TFB-10046 SS5]|nr:hypothetical protein AURDEDRAFT_164462 [Auricularia subglabra TFB-10046 SS5]
MHRMEHLTLLSVPASKIEILFQYDAPMLRSFVWGAVGDRCTLPTRWGAEHAPVLETLCLKPFSIPKELEPLAAVRTLYGHLGSFSGGRKGISSIFPFLETLHISSTAQEDLFYLFDLPASLKAISLETDIDFPIDMAIDYTPVISACQSLNLERLSIDRANDCLEVLRLFSTVVRGTWELRISTYNNDVVNMRACSDKADYTVHCHQPVSLSRQPSITEYIQRVARLSVSFEMLWELASLASWERHLPQLHHLEIYFWDSFAHPLPLFPGHTAAAHPILAPDLDVIWLIVTAPLDGEQHWILERFPAILPTLFAYTKSRLASITIMERTFSSLKRGNLQGLMSLAEHVWVSSEDRHEAREFCLREAFPTGPE